VLSEPFLAKPEDSPGKLLSEKLARSRHDPKDTLDAVSQQHSSPLQDKTSSKADSLKQPSPAHPQTPHQLELAQQKLIAEKLQLIPESHFFSENLTRSKAPDSQSLSTFDNAVKRKLKKLQIKEVFTNLYFD